MYMQAYVSAVLLNFILKLVISAIPPDSWIAIDLISLKRSGFVKHFSLIGHNLLDPGDIHNILFTSDV